MIMNKVTLKVSAKINLSLDVTGKRSDGYHNIESIFQSVDIYDTITVSKRNDNEIRISCSDPIVPCDRRNIAYKAAELFYNYTGITGGADIYIEKFIPSQAGLGGGSSDGAGVLYALNMLYDTCLNGIKLTELGGKVSADTAFFTVGGTAYVNGIGDEINSIRFIPKIDLVIAKGSSGISTPDAYSRIDTLSSMNHPETAKLLKAIDKGNFVKNCSLCRNVFENVANIDDVISIKKLMRSHGALNSLMSGSGSAVFGIFPDKETALKCTDMLTEKFPFAVYCRAVPDSILVINKE